MKKKPLVFIKGRKIFYRYKFEYIMELQFKRLSVEEASKFDSLRGKGMASAVKRALEELNVDEAIFVAKKDWGLKTPPASLAWAKKTDRKENSNKYSSIFTENYNGETGWVIKRTA